MINICILGASTSWTPGLATDLMCVFDEPLEIRLIDIDPRPAELCAEWGRAAAKHHGRKDRFIPYLDRRKALQGADAVIITLSTGGLDAMEHDIAIPEKYGIYATVGDTTGPGGWSRAIRNIGVFRQFAEDFQRICPTAFIANYTNPMAALTATLSLCCGNPTVGLCHAYFSTKDLIQKIFNLPDWSKISVTIAGMNHFTWVVDFKVDHQDGYALLREKVGSGSIRELLPEESADEIGIFSGHQLCAELYDAFGYLTYPADRHTSEFLSFTLSGRSGYPQRTEVQLADGSSCQIIEYCNLKRTSVQQRRDAYPQREKRIREMIEGKTPWPTKSRETGAEMIRAYLYNEPFTDAVNTLNVGQIRGLPLGSCVETLGTVDGLGVRPLMVQHVPEHLLEIMRPHAVCQKWTVQGMLEGNRDLLVQALYHDPQCRHLKLHEVRAMADELLQANRQWLPAELVV